MWFSSFFVSVLRIKKASPGTRWGPRNVLGIVNDDTMLVRLQDALSTDDSTRTVRLIINSLTASSPNGCSSNHLRT